MDTTNTKQSILIALPAKNEADKIKKVVNDIVILRQSLPSYTITIVVFDDASTDETRKEALSAGADVHTIQKSRGLGYVFTQITKRFLEGNFAYLVTIDADGQFDPKEIPSLLEPLITHHADFVTGSRFLKTSYTTNISWLKKIGNKIGARYVSSILRERFSDVTCGFRAYTREAILQLHTFSDFTYTQEVFLNLGIKKLAISEVSITTTYFPDRKSKMVKNIFRYISKSFKIILKSIIVYAPMRLFGTLGNCAFIVAMIAGLFVFFWDSATGSVTPYKWIGVLSVTSGVIGIVMYCAGILLQITSRMQLTIEAQLYWLKRGAHMKEDI